MIIARRNIEESKAFHARISYFEKICLLKKESASVVSLELWATCLTATLPPHIGHVMWYGDGEVECPERLTPVQRGQVVVGSEHGVVDHHVGQKVATFVPHSLGSTRRELGHHVNCLSRLKINRTSIRWK